MKFLLVLLLCLSMALAPAGAESEATFTAPHSGLTLTAPASCQAVKGAIRYTDFGDKYTVGEGIVQMTANYFPMPKAELTRLEAEEAEAEEQGDMEAIDKLLAQMTFKNLFRVYGIDGGRGIDDLKSFLIAEKNEGVAANALSDAHIEMLVEAGYTLTPDGKYELPESEKAENRAEIEALRFTEIGQCEGFTYILIATDPEAAAELPEAYREEYVSLLQNVDQIVFQFTGGVALSKPVDLAEEGTRIHFETTDLQGNPVSSEALFAGHPFTMINLWATWCAPCKAEMPELEQMSRTLAEKNCQIIGIATDAKTDSKLEKARNILRDKGVTYVNIAPFEGLTDTLPFGTLPTTYFVDENGTLIGDPVAGAHVKQYLEIIEVYTR